MQKTNPALAYQRERSYDLHMEKHEQKYCPKCGNAFTCKMGDIINCQCSTVEISEATARFLSSTCYDCLCRDCLKEIDHDIKVAGSYRFPTQKEMLIEGLHYYKEGNYWVFTEMYHILRGYCCRSGCRHCAYGFTKPPG
jgi:hypothetical protein